MRIFSTAVTCVLIFSMAVSASESRPTGVSETARFTVRVLTEKEKPAREFTELETVNGQRVRQLRREQSGSTVEIPVGAYVILRFPREQGLAGFEIYPPGVLQPPLGVVSLPRGVLGTLRAIGPGTAIISVKQFVLRNRIGLEQFNTTTLSNWGGYVLSGGPFTSIRGAWTVPSVQGDAGSRSVTWIGIDGSTDMTLIQTGTSQNYSCGWFGWSCGTQYYAWYEILPQPETQIPYPVSPGDKMLAVITIGGGGVPIPGSPMIWLINLWDLTANWSFFDEVTYSGMLSSAEWIEEAPTHCDIFGCGVDEIANFGSVTFDAGDLVVPGGIPNFNSSEMTSVSQTVNGFPVCATPSNPDADKDGFTVAFGCGQPAPPGPFITTTSLPNGAVSRNYQQQLQVSGDSSAQWQIVSGSLPPPLTLSPSGSINGIPNSTGMFNFTVQATDASNPGAFSQMQPLSITVMQTEPPPDFQLTAGTIVLQSGPFRCTGSTTVTAMPLFGFTGILSYSASNVPAGATASFVRINADSSTLTLTAAPCWLTSTQVTVTGVSGGVSHQIQVPVQLLPYRHGGK